jgi:ABC-2 type transport system permease protein
VTPRLFTHLASLEARKLMSYRADFWITAVANLVATVLVHWFLWRSIFATTGAETLGGFTFPAMMTYLIGVNLIGRVVRGSDLQLAMAAEIYDGGLSRYLLYPTHYALFKYAQHIGAIVPELIQMFVFAGVLVATFGLPADSGFTAVSIALVLPALWVGNLLYFLLSVPLQLVAFWADNVWSLGVMLRFSSMLLGGAMLPLAMFPEGMAETLRWLPFVACYEFPVRVAMGQVTPAEYAAGLATGLGWCAAVAIGTVPLWRRGERGYTGVGI